MDNNTNILESKILFFDINETILDITSLKSFLNEYFNENIYDLWFSKLLHYSLVATATGKFKNFLLLAADALNCISVLKGIPINKGIIEKLCFILSTLPAYSDVENTLKSLKEKGFYLVALSNSSPKLLEKQLVNANINQLFDTKISVEEFGVYKPHLSVYSKAATLLNVSPKSCMLIAAHDWDVYGALCAGWKATFVKRSLHSQYILSIKPNWEITNLEMIIDKICQCNIGKVVK